jgi:hypothetical protein
MTGEKTLGCSPKALELANIADELTEKKFNALMVIAKQANASKIDMKLRFVTTPLLDENIKNVFDKLEPCDTPLDKDKPEEEA